MTGHDTKNHNLLLEASLSISSNIRVTNLKKIKATIGNNMKHKTFNIQTNKTIGNQKKRNLLSDTEY
jgi:hypothetical protein